MKNILPIALILLTSLSFICVGTSDYYTYRWFFLFCLFVVFTMNSIAKNASFYLSLLVGLLMISGGYLCLFRDNYFFHLFGKSNPSLMFLEAKTLLFVCAFSVAISQKRLGDAAFFVNAMSVVLIIASFVLDIFVKGCNGFAYNSSVTSTTFSLLLPFCFLIESKKQRLILASAITLMICHYHGMSGIIGAAIFWTFELKRLYKLVPILLIVAGCFLFPSITSSSGRFIQYDRAIDFWLENFNLYVGSGNGTFQFLYPVMQQTIGATERGFFLWLHSDAIQSILEIGLVGFSFVVLVAVELFKIAKGSKFITSFLIIFISCSLVNFPIHMSSDVLLLTIVMRYAYNLRDRKNKGSFYEFYKL